MALKLLQKKNSMSYGFQVSKMGIRLEIEHPRIGKHPKTNFTKVYVGPFVFWFSYTTIVAFKFYSKKYVSKNEWSNTTGRHLNQIEPDHKKRIDYDVFLVLLDHALGAVMVGYKEEIKLEKKLKEMDEYLED